MQKFSLSDEINNNFSISIELLHGNNSEDLHNSRKYIKKFRSLIRLIRYSVPKEAFFVLNSEARDIAKSLAALRDFDSAIEACNRNYILLDSYYRNLCTRTKNKIEKLKNAHKTENTELYKINIDRIKSINETLNETNIEDIKINETVMAFVKTHKSAHKCAYSLKLEDDIFFFHEWRKKVKYLRYQANYFTPYWPNYYLFLENELHILSNLLGNMQDNILVLNYIKKHKLLNDKSSENYQNLTINLNNELKTKSIILGQKLFAHSSSSEFFKLHSSIINFDKIN